MTLQPFYSVNYFQEILKGISKKALKSFDKILTIKKRDQENINSVKNMDLSEFNQNLEEEVKEYETYRDLKEFKILWKTEGIYNSEISIGSCPSLMILNISIGEFDYKVTI